MQEGEGAYYLNVYIYFALLYLIKSTSKATEPKSNRLDRPQWCCQPQRFCL